MLARTHIALGLITSLLVASFFTISHIKDGFDLVTVLVIVFASLLPDLDMGNSFLAGKFGILKARHIQKIWFMILGILTVLIFKYLRNTAIFYASLFIIVLGMVYSKDFARKGYHVLRRFVQGMVGVGFIAIGFYYKQYPLFGIGGVLLLLLFSRHRGLSHSLLFVAIVYFVVKEFCRFYSYRDYSLLFAITVASHIVGDMFTRAGVALFFPLSQKRIRFPITIRTGGKFENIVFLGACMAILHLITLL